MVAIILFCSTACSEEHYVNHRHQEEDLMPFLQSRITSLGAGGGHWCNINIANSLQEMRQLDRFASLLRGSEGLQAYRMVT